MQADLAGGALVRCQPDKVERVLYNLLTNALRHTPSDGSVAVRVEPNASEVRVSVEDTGDGLTETAERMFERFWRGDRARSSDGAGLGLAIARGSSRPTAAGSGPKACSRAGHACRSRWHGRSGRAQQRDGLSG